MGISNINIDTSKIKSLAINTNKYVINDFKNISNQEVMETIKFNQTTSTTTEEYNYDIYEENIEDKLSQKGIKKEDIISTTTSGQLVTAQLSDGNKYTYKKTSSGKMNLTSYETYENNILKEKINYNEDESINSITAYQNGLIQKIDKYDETGEITNTYVYDETGKIITNVYSYEYDNDGNITMTIFKDINSKMITKTKYENGTKTTISKYSYNELGKETLINTIDYSQMSELIKNRGNLTQEDIDSLQCFDNSTNAQLKTSLTSILTQEEIEQINQKIKNNVEYSGKSTGTSVATAAITLITELQNKGIYLPYYYGGGHCSMTGIDSTWGTTVAYTGLTELRNIKSMDCSGFLMWAMQNGGVDITSTNGNIKNILAGEFSSLPNTNIISFNELTPGDVLDKNTHVVLVLDTYKNDNGETIAICAEATGDEKNGTENGGVIITTFTEKQASSYTKVDMDNYYQNHSQ